MISLTEVYHVSSLTKLNCMFIKTLQTIMGHADIETTLDRYTHAQEERVRAAGELLTGKFKSSDS